MSAEFLDIRSSEGGGPPAVIDRRDSWGWGVFGEVRQRSLLCFSNIQGADDGESRKIDFQGQLPVGHAGEVEFSQVLNRCRIHSFAFLQEVTVNLLTESVVGMQHQLAHQLPVTVLAPDLDVDIQYFRVQDQLP